ncbi:MAG: sterol desaturase family protein [Gammaproteobacteria bacterium]|nr:sterol desaturase family protein [Gammaproteobacteria bacterium]MYD80145.1 sterol desaturase family protein [Gammaproteobacteria bacterium]
MLISLRSVTTLISYPFGICASYALFAFLSSFLALEIAAYVSVLFGAAVVTLHELAVPYRNEWNPTWFEIANDTTYMIVCQVFFERVLTLAALFIVVRLATIASWQGVGFWPHDWPVWLQAGAILVIGDFLRYWLHRGFHRFPWMWRLHAVHHSPERLYWLNVGRFHPLEQVIQFIADALPFILLGVSTDVLSVYFVFYAVNGFYQHSNCHVRLGWLNWIVAGPELHRWHHSLDLRESNNNFGNNLIVWDLLFGTRYLPQDREVTTLGIAAINYPMDFLRQLAAPFRVRLPLE